MELVPSQRRAGLLPAPAADFKQLKPAGRRLKGELDDAGCPQAWVFTSALCSPTWQEEGFMAVLLSCTNVRLPILVHSLHNTSMICLFWRTWAEPFFSWPLSNSQLSLVSSHVALMGSPPLQELVWRLVRPFASLSKLHCLFYITAYLPMTHLIALILHAPSRSLRAASLFHCCLPKSFSEECRSQENIFQANPFPAPLRHHCWELPEGLSSASHPYAACQRHLLCRGRRAAVRQLSWDHSQPKLCLWWNSILSLSLFTKIQMWSVSLERGKGNGKRSRACTCFLV